MLAARAPKSAFVGHERAVLDEGGPRRRGTVETLGDGGVAGKRRGIDGEPARGLQQHALGGFNLVVHQQRAAVRAEGRTGRDVGGGRALERFERLAQRDRIPAGDGLTEPDLA